MASYVQDRILDPDVATSWAALSADKKATYLVNATRSLDMGFQWIGDRYSRDQRQHWPRTNAVVDGFLLDNITFPTAVKEATCEMAAWSMGNDGAVSVGTNAAFDSIRVGPINIDFNENIGGAAKQYVPDVVAYILSEYGVLEDPNLPSSNRLKVVRLQRA